MRKRNRKNFPFVILLIIHSLLLGVTFYKNKNRKSLLILLGSNIGFAYLFEYFILNLFQGYKYKPKVLKNRTMDNILGAVLSQAIFVPFTALFLTAFQMNWIAKLAASLYFTIIEEFFIRLGVYKHYWWKTIYTSILVVLYFKISDFWYRYTIKKNPVVQLTSLFLMILVTKTNYLFFLAILRKVRFGLRRFHSWKNHFIISPLYSIVFSALTVWTLRKKNDWASKWRVIIIEFIFYQLLIKMNILKSKQQFIPFISSRILMYNIYGHFRDWIYGKGGESKIKGNKKTPLGRIWI